MKENLIDQAARILINSHHTTVFSGAGISVESGIPPFRGPEGLWSKYDPDSLEITFFRRHPLESWKVIKEIFYDYFGNARPNRAHEVVAKLEEMGIVKAVITQNIDNLHQEAGSKNVLEFHGNYSRLLCMRCGKEYDFREEMLNTLPPLCGKCGGLLKPDFVFFGEMIPEPANTLSFEEAEEADAFLLIGTTGEVYPAASIPAMAKNNGAKIIEVNTGPSNHTDYITDIFLQGKATEIMDALLDRIRNA